MSHSTVLPLSQEVCTVYVHCTHDPCAAWYCTQALSFDISLHIHRTVRISHMLHDTVLKPSYSPFHCTFTVQFGISYLCALYAPALARREKAESILQLSSDVLIELCHFVF